LAGQRWLDAEDRFNQRRFSRAVAAQQPREAAALEAQVDVLQHHMRVVADGEVLKGENGISHGKEKLLNREEA